eukprot:6114429-Pleurochrysis_carterae.AAC.2
MSRSSPARKFAIQDSVCLSAVRCPRHNLTRHSSKRQRESNVPVSNRTAGMAKPCSFAVSSKSIKDCGPSSTRQKSDINLAEIT